MREVQIVSWCDGDHAVPAPADVSRTVVVDGGEAIILDLCAEHDREFFDPLLALMEFGAPVLPSKRKRKTNTTCPKCGRSFKSRDVLGHHTRTRHGMGLKEAKA